MHSCKGNRLTEKGSSGIAPATLKGESIQGKKYDWIRHARIFIVDGYTYPLAPDIEFDAKRLAETMVDMHANVLRIATSGEDWFIPGTEFKVVDDLGNRDILAECIAACKPRGIKVVPYLRTGGSISASSMKPEWVRVENPHGDIKSFRGDTGGWVSTFCWNTAYRQAFYDYVKIVVSKYDIDGIYFDAWGGYGFGTKICYCEGCKKGFKKLTGEDLPYRENANEYTAEELKRLDRYREWCKEELFEAFSETKRIIKSYKDIPLINNINNPGEFCEQITQRHAYYKRN